MNEPELPDQLQHLKNIIEGAKGDPNHCLSLLRNVIKAAADEAPEKDVIRMAEFILKRGIEIDKAKQADSN